MYDIVFEKAKDRAGKVSRTGVYAEVAVRPKGSSKKIL